MDDAGRLFCGGVYWPDAVLQVVVRALESGLLATGPTSSGNGSGLGRIRQEAGLSGTSSVARKHTGALMTFSA